MQNVLLSPFVAKREAGRVNMQVPVAPHTRDFVDQLAERMGMPKTRIVARVFEWFESHSEEFQRAVLLRDEVEQAKRLAEWMAEFTPLAVTPPAPANAGQSRLPAGDRQEAGPGQKTPRTELPAVWISPDGRKRNVPPGK